MAPSFDAPLLDTNVIIRYVARDDPGMAARAHTYFEGLESGAEAALLTEAVLLEAVQVLGSRALYNLPRSQIASSLWAIIELRGVRLPGKSRYLRALDLYERVPALDFVDALLVAYAERQTLAEIVSFDRDFDHVPGVTRREPGDPLR